MLTKAIELCALMYLTSAVDINYINSVSTPVEMPAGDNGGLSFTNNDSGLNIVDKNSMMGGDNINFAESMK